jgi:hypothetical protein
MGSVGPREDTTLCRVFRECQQPRRERGHACVASLPSNTFLSGNMGDPTESTSSKRRDCCLHPHLDGFKWAECNVRDEFGRCTGSQVDQSLTLMSVIVSHQVGVEFLKEFISTVLEGALSLL